MNMNHHTLINRLAHFSQQPDMRLKEYKEEDENNDVLE